ncbi:peptide chain release factor N(5)-glutamine methyltransferase [Anaerocolumna sp. MB42-C2]|uniref:peptide chain release factor N(5)-glutamine methyltransferase n=1 Tax=Anaerocolumna sp. MB42-C2 TaxID=3070997 RepID=UPI0027E16E80|nr:peptide chain release factor N(5)-glutamine methyltransferase [Anaerocolumna sp. MB42-C2]WMJ85939.1 peptide chain release factor N(5)-glutamine methyltransferase [Anaerocolumna sp. MB42-C2]
MITLENALNQGKAVLKGKGIADWDIDAWYLFSYYFQINRTQFILHSQKDITEEQLSLYLELIQKRSEHIPLQYITKEQEFMGLKFHVTEDVLIPRLDTEILVEEVLKVSAGKDILDICTGSGCIIISLSKLGKVKSAAGVDISPKALEIARENASKLKADVTFIESDMYTQVKDRYDIIVSNPPYIPTQDIAVLMREVKDHEPILALDGSTDGLYFYKIIIHDINLYLKPDGYVFFEIGYNQAEAVSELLREAGITDINLKKDLAGLNRVISGRFKKTQEPFT